MLKNEYQFERVKDLTPSEAGEALQIVRQVLLGKRMLG
jgi:hypothetical protein